MVPQPVLAVLMLFPITDASEKAQKEQDTQLRVRRQTMETTQEAVIAGVHPFVCPSTLSPLPLSIKGLVNDLEEAVNSHGAALQSQRLSDTEGGHL